MMNDDPGRPPAGGPLPLVTDTLKAAQSPRFRALYDTLVDRLRAVGSGLDGPGVSDPFPDFLLPDLNGALVGRDALLRDGPMVLSFVRGHWCPYCRAEMAALRQRRDALLAAGGRPVVVTPEARGRPRAMQTALGLDFPVLCDLDNGLALACGLVFPVPEDLRAAYLEAGRILPDHYDNDSWFLPIPATYVVDRDGIIRFAHVDPDFRDRPDPLVFVDALRALG